MNYEKIGKAITYLFLTKGREVTEPILETWCNEIKDYPDEAIEQAIKELIDTKDVWITVGHIKEKLGVDTPEKLAEEAWEKLRMWSGGKIRWQFLGNIIETAIEGAGGSLKLKECENDFERNQIRKDFIRNYVESIRPVSPDGTVKTLNDLKEKRLE